MSERILGDFDSGDKSNLMILVGALHGNELAGYKATNNVFDELRKNKTKINGRVVGIAGNLQAIAAKKRFIDHDLNRAWKPEILDRVLATPEEELTHEDLELKILHGILDDLGTQGYKNTYLIDMHTTSADNGIFLVHPGYPDENSIARELRLPTVINLDIYLPGTLLKFMRGYGFNSFAFEAGQIGSEKAIDIHTFGIWELLHKTGIIDQSRDLGHLIHYEEILASLHKPLPGIVKVLHRHEIKEGDYFHMKPGYENFQTVRGGELLAQDKSGEILAPMDGLIFMPLYQNAGNDGFFIVEEL